MTQEIETTRSGLVGRVRELGYAATALSSAYAGHGLLLLLSGEAGIGKTRLAEELADRAAADGVSVAWVTCSATAGPLWPWRRAVQSLGLGELDVDAAAAGDSDPDEIRLRLFTGVAARLRAQPGRVLLVLDDLQLADVLSLQFLEFLADEQRRDPVAVVGCLREPPDGPASPGLTDLARRAAMVRVGGLAAPELAPMVTAATGVQVSDDVVGWLTARSQGNPLFAIELARLLPAEGGPASGLGALPATIRDVIRQRLDGVGPDLVEILSPASVVGETFGLDVLARMTGQPRMALADRCAEAAGRGLVRALPDALNRFTFAHPLLREVLYEGLLPSHCRELHRRTAEALELRPDVQAAEVAHHWFLAGEYADPVTTVRHLRRAAQDALAVCGWDEAVMLLSRGLEVVAAFGGAPGQRGELLLAVGEARLKTGDWEAAALAFQDAAAEARRLGDARLLAAAALGLGAGRGGFEVRLYDRLQLDLLAEARSMLSADDGDLTAWILARLSVALSLRADPDVRAALAQEAVSLARTLDDPLPLAHALAARCDAFSGPDHRGQRLTDASEVVSIAEGAGDRELELLGRRLRLVAFLEAGQIVEVDHEISRFARTADDLGQPLHRWYVPLWRAMRQIMEGRLDAASASADEAAALGARAGSRNAAILVQAQRITWLVASGRPQEACELCERAFPVPDFPATPGWLAGLLARAGRTDEAASLLDRLTADRFACIPRDSEWVAALCLAADGAAVVGHREAAAVLHDLLEPYAEHWAVDGIGAACLGTVSAYLAGLAAVLGQADEAAAWSADAQKAHRAAGARLLVGSTPRRGSGPASVRAGAPSSERCVFRRDGEIWVLEYAGRSARLRDIKGLHDLARLLAAPGREFHVLDLVTSPPLVRGAPTVGLHEPGHAGEVLDDAARSAYRHRLEELDQDLDELADLDPERAGQVREERQALVDALAAAYGLGGRSRRLDDPAERARSTVTQRIRAAVRRIEQQHPPLGAHLQYAIRTGTFCSYRPEQPITWAT